ncbi:MAG: RHS repeat-associated core domain-containing protein [Micromonosporaceae bacterium]
MRPSVLAAFVLLLPIGPAAFAQVAPSGNGGVTPLTEQQPYAVTVTPDGGWEPNRTPNSGPYTVYFTATNTGTNSQTFGFECWGTGGISCSGVSPTSRKLNPGQYQTLTVTYSVGATGGEIRVSASSAQSYDEGYKEVDVAPVVTLILPAATGGGADTVHSRQPLVRATYSPGYAVLDLSTLVLRWAGETVTSLARRNGALLEWEVDSTRALSPGVAKSLYLKICDLHGACTERTWSVVLDNSGTPIVSFTGMPLEALGRQFSAPFGPGLSLSGAEVETGFGTPPYYALSAPWATGLVYSTRQSYPRALVNTDIELTWPAGTPDQIKAYLYDGGVKVDSLIRNTPTCSAGTERRCRVTLQADFSGTTYAGATRKWLKVEVKVSSGGDSRTTTDSVEAVIVDRRSTPYGSGWFVSGVLRLYDAGSDKILVGPSGAATIFRGANGQYLSPPGDFSVLSWTGSYWTLQARDGSHAEFDGQGRHTWSADRRGIGTTVHYDTVAVERVWFLSDNLTNNIVFGYDASGHLSSITDPVGRRTSVTIDASHRLTRDSVVASDPTVAAVSTYGYAAYGGNNTLYLTSAADGLGQTTTVSYDATRRRPYLATLPAVLPETGSTPQTPTIGYRAQELRGLDTLISGDSVFVRITDPRGNWSASALNRWGAPTRSWDALGTTARAAYSPEGFPLWAEGKVADSSRVHTTYVDGLRIRSFRLRAAGDTVRLDSLVYNATGDVILSVNAWGQRDTLIYDGYGSLVRHIRFAGDTTGDTTHYTYYNNWGMLESRRAPNQIGSTHYTYDSKWNVLEEQNAAGVTLAHHWRDALGRDTTVTRLLTVRQYEPADSVQWRRSRTWYTTLNQVTRTRLERTDNCVAPCIPPAWPSDADTARWQQVEHFLDRLGRDTARANTSGRRTRYAYDALGRLLRRWPYADSLAVRDSLRYDLAGNLRFLSTRRGYVIEHRYDSRNRDTLTAVPGVGNFRRAYGGPSDQLTRAWIESYVDSIGGVSPAVSWRYSQGGLLLADTAQGSRVTTHFADRYGRDSLVTDPTGTWRPYYHAKRGVLDSLITPFGDTLRYTIDSWGRMVGPAVFSRPNPSFIVGQEWDDVGKLVDLTTTLQDTVRLGRWATEPDMPDLDLTPTWSEHHGAGGATVTDSDTLSHDAWRRVRAVKYVGDGSLLASESFTFTRDGDIRVSGEARTYHLPTGRMTARAGGSYSYDRAGNLVSWTPSGGSTWTYSYDALERLTAVRQGGAVVARYGYDVLGRRIVKRVYSGGNAGYVRMIYGGDNVVAEADSAQNLTLGYTWGLGTDDLVAVHRYGDARHWYVVQDVLRSVRGLVRRDGTWEASWRYRIYGAALRGAGTPSIDLRYRWAGREYDVETGFYYLRARYYDPASQRFVQEDPVGYAGGANLYAYTSGDPTKARDPSGLGDDYESVSSRAREEVAVGFLWDDNGGGSFWDQLDLSSTYHDLLALEYGTYSTQAEARIAHSEYDKAAAEVCRIEPAACSGLTAGSTTVLSGVDFDHLRDVILAIYETYLTAPSVSDNSAAFTVLTNLLGTGRIAYNETTFRSATVAAHVSSSSAGPLMWITPRFSEHAERQVWDLTHDAGHIWRHTYDNLSADRFALGATGQHRCVYLSPCP